MSILDSMEISTSGLYAQKTRMNAISSNIANINTTRTEKGGPYQRKTVIFAAAPKAKNFLEELEAKAQKLDSGQQVKVLGTVHDERAFHFKYEPNHPDANPEGYVAYPNVNITEEMVDMLEARRSFEANVAAFNVAKAMANQALEIGKL